MGAARDPGGVEVLHFYEGGVDGEHEVGYSVEFGFLPRGEF